MGKEREGVKYLSYVLGYSALVDVDGDEFGGGGCERGVEVCFAVNVLVGVVPFEICFCPKTEVKGLSCVPFDRCSGGHCDGRCEGF